MALVIFYYLGEGNLHPGASPFRGEIFSRVVRRRYAIEFNRVSGSTVTASLRARL